MFPLASTPNTADFQTGEWLPVALWWARDVSRAMSFWTGEMIAYYEQKTGEEFPWEDDTYPSNLYYHVFRAVPDIISWHIAFALPPPRFAVVDRAKIPIYSNPFPPDWLPMLIAGVTFDANGPLPLPSSAERKDYVQKIRNVQTAYGDFPRAQEVAVVRKMKEGYREEEDKPFLPHHPYVHYNKSTDPASARVFKDTRQRVAVLIDDMIAQRSLPGRQWKPHEKANLVAVMKYCDSEIVYAFKNMCRQAHLGRKLPYPKKDKTWRPSQLELHAMMPVSLFKAQLDKVTVLEHPGYQRIEYVRKLTDTFLGGPGPYSDDLVMLTINFMNGWYTNWKPTSDTPVYLDFIVGK